VIKVIIVGIGCIGERIARLVMERPYLECVGAIDIDPAKVGKDLGEVIGLGRQVGVKISRSFDDTIVNTKADIICDATYTWLKDIREPLFKSIKAGLNFVSTAEQLGYPAATDPDLAHEIDNLAKCYSVTVLGTGMNPGFIHDVVPISFMGVCEKVRRITARRAIEISKFSWVRELGFGQSLTEVKKRMAGGTLVPRVGPETVVEIADALGWKLIDKKRTMMEPPVSKTRRHGRFMTIEAGEVCGMSEEWVGIREDGEKAINLKLTLLFEPDDNAIKEDAEMGLRLGDFFSIEGEPDIEIEIKKGTSDTIVNTAARITNAIPYVINARPGLLSAKDFPPFVPLA